MQKLKLLPKVHDLIQDLNYDTFVLYGGRDSGKSYGVGTWLVAEATFSKQKVLCVREHNCSINDSVGDVLKEAIQLLNMQHIWECTNTRIRNKQNGSEFIFRGIKKYPDSIKSMNGLTRVWVEEAASVSKESWSVLEPTIRKENSKLYVTFNPYKDTDPTFQKFIINEPPYTKVIKMNYYDNKYLSDRSKRLIEHMKRTDYDEYVHVYEGECKKIDAAQILNGKYSVQNFQTPNDIDFFYGADWGFSQDPTTLVRCFIEDHKLYIDQEIYGIGIEITDLPKFFDQLPDSRKNVIYGDNARPEIISHLNKNGFTIKSASKWPGSVEDGISFLRSFDQIIIHERCTNTINEAKLYSYKVNRLTNEVQPDISDKNNHCIDAIRYALQPLIKIIPEPNIRFI